MSSRERGDTDTGDVDRWSQLSSPVQHPRSSDVNRPGVLGRLARYCRGYSALLVLVVVIFDISMRDGDTMKTCGDVGGDET